MPVKSSFFPKEALQGQDLPSHMIWEDLSFDFIKIVHSKALSLKEVYNVAKDDTVINEGEILIKKVEVDGYLGILFSTRILDSRASNEEIKYFFHKGNNVVEKLAFNVHLFRADVVISDVPSKIYVKVASGKVSPKILINNLGDGTAIIDVKTTTDSDLQKQTPQFVKTFRQEFIKGAKSGIDQLKKDFKEYSTLLNKIESILIKPIEFKKQALEKLKRIEKEFNSALEENEEFAKSFIMMLIDIMQRTVGFLNLYQFVSDYINSIGNEKIILRDPFNVIKLSKEPATLQIEIICIDLLKQICNPITLSPISISSEKAGEIALFRLFQWGETTR